VRDAVNTPAKQKTATNGAKKQKKVDTQALELAALVCSQAIRKNPNYAPIHNTAGLIQNELGQVNGAVAEFATAAKLDPKFFEAQMNYAAVNLSFRGFSEAEKAYDRALTRTSAPVIAVVFDDELLESVPIQAHDRPVNGTLTPLGGVRLL